MCTIAFWPDNNVAIISGRNMDWLDNKMNTNLWAFPRGLNRVGLTTSGENSLNWKSKYGSVAAGAYDYATADGINEKGFAMHELWLAGSDFGQRDKHIPGISMSLWGQFMLDNFETVAEAVDYMEKNPLQVVPVVVSDYKLTALLHMMVEDSSGDMAIFEYLNGKLVIHHDKSYRVMTNEPTFDEQLANLKKYEGFGGTLPVPGTTSPADRFVRAAFYLKQLQKPENSFMAIASLVSVLRNAAQPFGTVDPKEPNTAATIWQTVIDHTNMMYYFESMTSPYMIAVNLKKLDFNEGAPILKLDLQKNENDPLAGDVTSLMKPSQDMDWKMPEN